MAHGVLGPLLDQRDVICIPLGILSLIVCAPKDMAAEEVVRAANLRLPAGGSSRWQIAATQHLRDGTHLPAPCKDDDGRLHYLLQC